MQSPVALELPELLARSHIPQPDRLVVAARPTDKQGGIRWIETDAIYSTAVAFQRRQARAQFHVPDLEGHVPGRRHDGLAVGRKNARRNRITVIF